MSLEDVELASGGYVPESERMVRGGGDERLTIPGPSDAADQVDVLEGVLLKAIETSQTRSVLSAEVEASVFHRG